MSPDNHDPEYMTLPEIAERAELLIRYSLGEFLSKPGPKGRTPIDVDAKVFAIIEQVRLKCRPAGSQRSQKDSSRAYKPNKKQPSIGFMVNNQAYITVEPYKENLLRAFRAELDTETLATWFIQKLLNKAINRHWHQMAEVVLKIIYLYDFNHFSQIRRLLERFQKFDNHPGEEALRSWKSRTINELANWFGDFVVTTDERVGRRIEKHFLRSTNPEQYFPLVKEVMKIEALPINPCIVNPETKLESATDVERLLASLTISKSPEFVERLLMHFIACPDSFFAMLTALKINHFSRRIGIPDFQGARPSVSLLRRNMAREFEAHKIDLNKELESRDERRNQLRPNQLRIAVDGGEQQEISLNEKKEIALEGDEQVIQVWAEDDQGSLPVDVHYLSWNLKPNAKSRTFVTHLKGLRRLDFRVDYRRDQYGEITEALLVARYSQPRYLYVSGFFAAAVSASTAIMSLRNGHLFEAVGFMTGALLTFLMMRFLKTPGVSLRRGFSCLILLSLAASFYAWSRNGTPSIIDTQVVVDQSKSVDSSSPARDQIKHSEVHRDKKQNVIPVDDAKHKGDSVSMTTASKGTSDSKTIRASPTPPVETTSVNTGSSQEQTLPAVTSGKSKTIGGVGINPVRAPPQSSKTPSSAAGPINATGAAVANTEVEGTRRENRSAASELNQAPEVSRRISLGPNQIIQVRIVEPINSMSVREGESFKTVVVEPVYVNGKLLVPVDSAVFGKVSNVTTASDHAVKDSIEVRFFLLVLPDEQSVHIWGDLLSECPAQRDIKEGAFAPSNREKVAFVGDKQKGASIGPIQKRQSTFRRIESNLAYSSNAIFASRIPVTIDPRDESSSTVCFALETKVSIFPPRKAK